MCIFPTVAKIRDRNLQHPNSEIRTVNVGSGFKVVVLLSHYCLTTAFGDPVPHSVKDMPYFLFN